MNTEKNKTKKKERKKERKKDGNSDRNNEWKYKFLQKNYSLPRLWQHFQGKVMNYLSWVNTIDELIKYYLYFSFNSFNNVV